MSTVAEIWRRPWALVDTERRHRVVLNGNDVEIGLDHSASLWLYEPDTERAAINGGFDFAEPVAGFGLYGEQRRLSIIPFALRRTPMDIVSVGGLKTRVSWPSAPERLPSKLDPQTEAEKDAHRLMLRAKAVWDRLRDVEAALADPARLWPELRHRWTETNNAIPPSMDVIVNHAFALWRSVDELSRAPRRILRRTHSLIPLSRVQELDRRAMTWLVRQPGNTLAERAGDQQRVLAVVREENFDTLENRVLRAYCELAAHIAKDYLELNQAKRLTARARKVDAFGRASRRLARQLAEQGVRLAEPGVTPNFVLQHNARYHKVWTSWQELLERDRILDELWRWQARSWEEFCAIAVVVALVGISGAKLIAAAPLDFLGEQSRGSWISSDNPLATFYLAEQQIVVEVRYRMQSPERRLSDFAAPIWLRIGRKGDISGFLGHVAIWPIWDIQGGLVDGEVEELERVLSLGAKAHLAAGIVLRPARHDFLQVQSSSKACTMAIGAYGVPLWQGLAELTHFLTEVTKSNVEQ